MKRRLILEIETVDTIPGAMLDVVLCISEELEALRKEDKLVDYGVALEHDLTWFVKADRLIFEAKAGTGE
mgnify:CR=1 FL=1